MSELFSHLDIQQFLTATVLGMVIQWALSALAWALPAPEEIPGNLWYRTFHRLIQFAVANFPLAKKVQTPQG